MSFTTRYIKERIANKKDLLSEQVKAHLITEYYFKDHPNDRSIYNVFKTRDALVQKISNGCIWERTKNGFVSRRNFALDSLGEITFDVDKIVLSGNTIMTNGNNAFMHVNKFHDDLDNLMKVEGLIASYYEQHKDEIDQRLKAELKKNKGTKNITYGVYDEAKHTKEYLIRYGDHGRKLLIKWLNRLNTTTPIEELIAEFNRDVNNAITFFEIIEDEGFKKGVSMGISFEGMLLKVIERYSPRGELFMAMYRRAKNNVKGNAYVGH